MELPPIDYNSPSPYPTTMLTGTSPYKLGRGAPADLISLESTLRPGDTTQAKPEPVSGYDRAQKGLAPPPAPVMDNPISTRAVVQNHAFGQRYK